MKTLQVVESIKQGKFDDQFLEIYADFKLVAYERARYIQAIQRYNIDFDAGSSYDIEIFSAPGRSEIGGNHTDHQLGKVLAASLNLDVVACVIPTDDNIVTYASKGYNVKPVDVSDITIHEEEKNSTEALIRGVASGLNKRGYNAGGFKCYAESDVINGGGMSSSAAFEVLLGTIQNDLYNEGNVSTENVAKIAEIYCCSQ